jgi:hypothetical protein
MDTDAFKKRGKSLLISLWQREIKVNTPHRILHQELSANSGKRGAAWAQEKL